MNTPVERPTPRPGPNDCLPCPSDSARRRHLARAEHCDTCRVEGAVRLERAERAA